MNRLRYWYIRIVYGKSCADFARSVYPRTKNWIKELGE